MFHPLPLLYNTPRHFLLFVSFISFILLIYHSYRQLEQIFFSRFFVSRRVGRLFFFSMKRGKVKEKKYRTKKKICPYFPSSFKSSRNGVTSILFTLFLVTVFDDIKERKKITIPSTFFFFFFGKIKVIPLRRQTHRRQFPLSQSTLTSFLSPCPKKIFEQV